MARSMARSSLWARRSSAPVERPVRGRLGAQHVLAALAEAQRQPPAIVGSWVRSTSPARTRVSTARLTAGAPRPSACATSPSVAGWRAAMAPSSLRCASSVRSAAVLPPKRSDKREKRAAIAAGETFANMIAG